MFLRRPFENTSLALAIKSQNPVFQSDVFVIPQWPLQKKKKSKNPSSSIFETVMMYDCPAIDSSAVLRIGSPAVTSSGTRIETNEM